MPKKINPIIPASAATKSQRLCTGSKRRFGKRILPKGWRRRIKLERPTPRGWFLIICKEARVKSNLWLIGRAFMWSKIPLIRATIVIVIINPESIFKTTGIFWISKIMRISVK